MTFEILDATDPQQYERWSDVWKRWPQREVFAHPGYVRLYATDKARPLCALLESDDGVVLYPFLKRSLVGEPFWTAEMPSLADITSPYGYGGIFYWGSSDSRQLSRQFWENFHVWATREHVVSEFVRFSLFPDTLAEYVGHSEQRLLNVVRSLTCSVDELWMDFEHKVRKNVNKAKRLQVTIERDDDGIRLDEFLTVYYQTMERRDAGQSYYFPRTYFEHLLRDLAGHYAFFYAIHEGRIVSTELVLVSAENVYSFLGGTDEEAFDLRPNDLLKYEIMLWAKGQGKQRFVLGGGYGGEDGIFRYKLAFAPNGTVPFFTGQRVLNSDLYRQLVYNRLHKVSDNYGPIRISTGFFPEYRA